MYLPVWVPLRKIDDSHLERLWPLEFENEADVQEVETILLRLQTDRFRPTIEFTDRRHATLRVLIVDRGEEHEYVLRLYHLFWKLRDAGDIKAINGVRPEAWAPRKILVWPALESGAEGFQREWGVKFSRTVSDAEIEAAAVKFSAPGFEVEIEKTAENAATLEVTTDREAWTDYYAICAIELLQGIESLFGLLPVGGSGPGAT